jgi:hypothetical protein
MLPVSPMPMQPAGGYGAQKVPGADKKIAAGICGIVLGGLIMLSVYLVSWIIAIVTCGIGTPLIFITTVIGIIEGIIYLTKSDEEFVQTYVLNKKPWF